MRTPALPARLLSLSISVLIVDDSPQFLEAALGLLRREQLHAAGVMTIAQALEETERMRPDVVLVDVMLAGESGFDLARRLAAPERTTQPPVILISTHTAEDLEDLIAASPAVGFLPKSELAAEAILSLLGSGRQDL
jgi:CheY-like chemotaxis protein